MSCYDKICISLNWEIIKLKINDIAYSEDIVYAPCSQNQTQIFLAFFITKFMLKLNTQAL